MALGFVFNYLLGINTNFGMLIGGGIVVTYSAFGGIRSVITTDIIQFAVLVIAIPIVLNIMLVSLILVVMRYLFTQVAHNQPEYQSNDLWGYTLIFVSFCLPRLYPSMIQRCLAARDAEATAYKSLNSTPLIIITCIYVIMISIGVASTLALSQCCRFCSYFLISGTRPHAYRFERFCNCRFACNIIMSTADTELNTGSVALVHDVIKKISTTKISEPRLASITTFAMGAYSL